MCKCKNCGAEFESSFCPNCGTPAEENRSEVIQREIELYGVDETWKKYCPDQHKRTVVAKTFNTIINIINPLLFCIVTLISYLGDDYFATPVLILAISVALTKIPAEMFDKHGWWLFLKKIEFIQNNGINIKNLLTASNEKFKNENNNIAYYTVNNDIRKKSLIKYIIDNILCATPNVVFLFITYFFASDIINLLSKFEYSATIISFILAAALIIVAVIFIIIAKIYTKKFNKNGDKTINKWVREYLSSND